MMTSFLFFRTNKWQEEIPLAMRNKLLRAEIVPCRKLWIRANSHASFQREQQR
jgi:hypothetical protein